MFDQTHNLIFLFFYRIQKLQLRPVLYKFPYLVSRENTSFSNDNELHVYIPDDQKLKESLNHFLKIYSSRTNTNHECWLLDISSWATLNEALNSLQGSYTSYFLKILIIIKIIIIIIILIKLLNFYLNRFEIRFG